MKQKLGYILSGGGPRTLSHLGILKRLEEEKIKPDVVVGSSAGGIIGGLYSQGMPVDEIIELALSGLIKDMFSDYSVLHISRDGFGAVKGNKLLEILREKTGNKSFKDLKIPLAMNAVDYNTSKEVTLKKGKVANAMRASSSIPLIFKPFLWNKRYLVDGSVATSFPTHLAHDLGATKTLGISFVDDLKLEETTLDNFTFSKLKDIALDRLEDSVFQNAKMVLSFPFIDTILSSIGFHDPKGIEHYFKMHNNSVAGNQKADLLLRPDVTGEYNLEKLIKKGYKYADKRMAEILEEVKPRSFIRFW